MSTAATVDEVRDVASDVPELVLASSSPRRRRLLDLAGLSHVAISPVVDDSDVSAEIGPGIAERTVALAWMKAAATVEELRRRGRGSGLILAADTMVVVGDRAVGKPASAEEAEAMLRTLADRTHPVWTGHAIFDLGSGGRRLWAEAAVVRFGAIDEARLRRHLEAEGWRGRAGGYSLDEVSEAGWPVRCSGDPEVVLGLSTAGVRRAIASLAAEGAGRS